MIICAGILIWLFEKYSRNAGCASFFKRSAWDGESVANFSRSVPEVSARSSQNCSGEIGAAILDFSSRTSDINRSGVRENPSQTARLALTPLGTEKVLHQFIT